MSENYKEQRDQSEQFAGYFTDLNRELKKERYELLRSKNNTVQEISKKFNIPIDTINEAIDSAVYADYMEKNNQGGKYTDEQISESYKVWDELVKDNEELFNSLTVNDETSPIYFQKLIDDKDLEIAEHERLSSAHKKDAIKSDMKFAFEEIGFDYMQLVDKTKTIVDLQELHKKARDKLENMYLSGGVDRERYMTIGKYLTDENLRLIDVLNKRIVES